VSYDSYPICILGKLFCMQSSFVFAKLFSLFKQSYHGFWCCYNYCLRRLLELLVLLIMLHSVLARISKGQGATSEKGTFMRKRWLKKGTLMHKD